MAAAAAETTRSHRTFSVVQSDKKSDVTDDVNSTEVVESKPVAALLPFFRKKKQQEDAFF
jgi:hypothetical protein